MNKGLCFNLAVFLFFIFSQGTAESASFLEVPVGAKAVAMGSANTALSDDVTAIYWNPAGIKPEVKLGVSHAALFNGAKHDFIGFTYARNSQDKRVRRTTAFGVGLTYLSYSAMDLINDQGQKYGDFTASDIGVTLSVSRNLNRRWNVGLSFKFIRSYIESVGAQTFATDFGLLRKTRKLDVAAALQNLGPGLRFVQEKTALPLTLSLGLGYRPRGAFVMSADFKQKMNQGKSILSIGGEFPVYSMFFLRGGYLASLASIRTRTASMLPGGLTAGLGLNYGRVTLDFAVEPAGELGQILRISAQLKL